jgi:hypothetical protein
MTEKHEPMILDLESIVKILRLSVIVKQNEQKKDRKIASAIVPE